MAYGIEAGRKTQIGLEVTKGTEVDATKIWVGEAWLFKDARTLVFPKENVGFIAPRDRSYTPMYRAEISQPATPSTFEQLPMIMCASIKNVVTGSADGVGTGYIYTYTAHTSAASLNTLKALTVESGDNGGEEQSLYNFCLDWTLTGKAGEAWTIESNWVGRTVAPGTYTSALTPSTVEEMLFSKSKLYYDAIGGTLGSTQLTSTFLAAKVSYKSGLMPVFTGDGNLYFTFDKATPPEALIDVTFEHETQAIAAKADWRAETAKLLEIKILGSSLQTPGTTYSTKTVNVNAAGKWDSWDVLDSQDGNDIIHGVFRAGYDATATRFFDVVVCNDIATIF